MRGGKRKGYFSYSEVTQLRNHIKILTSTGAPYGRFIRLIEVFEEGRKEEFVNKQQIPLDNRNSKSILTVEREFSRETTKMISAETSLGIGVDYYISLNLETRFGINKEEKISERLNVKMEAQPGEYKMYTIIWKEIWITGHAVFDIGQGNQREKVHFKLKSGLEPQIKQESIS